MFCPKLTLTLRRDCFLRCLLWFKSCFAVCLHWVFLKFVLRLFCLLSVKVYCANRHLYFFRVCVFCFLFILNLNISWLFCFLNCLCAFPFSYECMCVCECFKSFVNWKMERKVTERFLSTTNVCVSVCVYALKISFYSWLFTFLCLVFAPLVQLYSHLHLLSSTRFLLGNIKIKQFKNNLLLNSSHTRAFVPFLFCLPFDVPSNYNIFNTYFVLLFCFTLVTLTTFLCFF